MALLVSSQGVEVISDGLSCEAIVPRTVALRWIGAPDEDAVKTMAPEVVICSIGKYPSTYAKQEYESLGASVYSTRFHGSIRAQLWYDGDVWITNHQGDRIHTLS